mgnify:CR=1 FL=1
MENEKLEILKMIKDGTVTPEEGLKLLETIEQEKVKFVFDEKRKPADKAEKKTNIFTVKIDAAGEDIKQKGINSIMKNAVEISGSDGNASVINFDKQNGKIIITGKNGYSDTINF